MRKTIERIERVLGQEAEKHFYMSEFCSILRPHARRRTWDSCRLAVIDPMGERFLISVERNGWYYAAGFTLRGLKKHFEELSKIEIEEIEEIEYTSENIEYLKGLEDLSNI